MELEENSRWTKMTVHVDGKHYKKCTFQDCVMIYGGGELPVFENTDILNSRWQLTEGANRTIELLRSLYANGLQAQIEQLFESIRGKGGSPMRAQ